MKSVFILGFMLLFSACSSEESFNQAPPTTTPAPEPEPEPEPSPSIPNRPHPDLPDNLADNIQVIPNQTTRSIEISWPTIPNKFSVTLCRFDANLTESQNYCSPFARATNANTALSFKLGTSISMEQLLVEDYFFLFLDTSDPETEFADGIAFRFSKPDVINRLIQFIKASNTTARDEFGFSVAMSSNGKLLAVGSRFQDSTTNIINDDSVTTNSGAVYVFVDCDAGASCDCDSNFFVDCAITAGWQFSALIKHPSPDPSDNFGQHIAMNANGTVMAISIPRDDSREPIATDNDLKDSGSVAIYSKTSAGWTIYAIIKSNVKQANMRFGLGTIALSPDAVTLAVGHYSGVVGSSAFDKNERVEIFRVSAGRWSYVETLRSIPNSSSVIFNQNDGYGSSLAFTANGGFLAVGAVLDDSEDLNLPENNDLQDSGSVYIYQKSGNTFNRVKYLKPNTPIANQRFGNSVSFSSSGAILAVGAERSNSAYIFDYNANTWPERYEITLPTLQQEDRFAHDVVLNQSGDTLFVGTMDANEAKGINGDIASVDFASLGGIYKIALGSTEWQQELYIKPPVINRTDFFGFSSEISAQIDRINTANYNAIAINSDGKILAVGAPSEDSSSIGVNNTTDNSALEAGAAYIYYF